MLEIISGGGLSMLYYLRSCPFADMVVKNTVNNALQSDPTLAAALIRMHFHDCFIQGCDASVLIDSTKNNTAENDSPANLSLRGYEIIDDFKTKAIKRSLEDDFKTIVGVSPVLWASFVIFLLLNVNGWKALFWGSLIPLMIILAVGTELQAILIKMATDITHRHAVVQGIPLVQASDKYFWFGRPRLVLQLIYFAIFQNAFQIVYFFWIWYEFGLRSCFHNNFELVIAKLILGVGVLVLCSYITLPLYALIDQMGSNLKQSIFDEQTSKALQQWRMAVKKKQGGKSPTRTLGGGRSSSSVGSTINSALQRFKTLSPSTRTYNYEAHEVSDLVTDDDDSSSHPIESRDELVLTVNELRGMEMNVVNNDQERMLLLSYCAFWSNRLFLCLARCCF